MLLGSLGGTLPNPHFSKHLLIPDFYSFWFKLATLATSSGVSDTSSTLARPPNVKAGFSSSANTTKYRPITAQLGLKLDLLVPLDFVEGGRVKVDLDNLQLGFW